MLDLANKEAQVNAKTISNPSEDGWYNCFQSFIGNTNFVLVKDNKALSLINTKKLTAIKLIDSVYDDCNNINSMIQSKEGDKIFVYDLRYNS